MAQANQITFRDAFSALLSRITAASLWMLVVLLGVGGCHGEQAKPAPPALSGKPSWLAIGPDVYQEKDRDEAETQVLAVRSDCPRWFLGYSKSVSKEDFDAYLQEQRQDGTKILMESADGKHFLPTAVPYPRGFDDLPTEDQGVRLALGAGASNDPSYVLLTLKLSSQTRDVEREVEHRWTNTLPFLFAFYVDGQAVQVRSAGFGRDGGVNYAVPLVKAGGEHDWAVKVDAASLRALLPDGRPHELAIVAAFSDRQHEWFAEGSDHVMRLSQLFMGHEGHKQIVVRSEAARLQWTGERWAATSGPTTRGRDQTPDPRR